MKTEDICTLQQAQNPERKLNTPIIVLLCGFVLLAVASTVSQSGIQGSSVSTNLMSFADQRGIPTAENTSNFANLEED